MKIINFVVFTAILLFVAACDPFDCGDSSPEAMWFTCQQLSNDASGKAQYMPITLYYDSTTDTLHSLTGATIPSQVFDCTPYQPQGQGQGNQPVNRPKDHTPIGTAPAYTPHPSANQLQSQTAYPRRILDLPFRPLRSQAQLPPPPSSCDASFADVLLVNQTNNTVTRLSTCPYQAKTTIPVAAKPIAVDITPDARTAVVTSYTNAVNFIDIASNRVSFTLTTDFNVNPFGVAISPDGTRAYVTSYNNSNPEVLVIDVATHAIVATIPVAPFPLAAFLTPDGSQLYVTFPTQNAVYVIDTLTNSLATTLSIAAPYGIDFNPTGTRAYIASATGSPANLVVLDTSTYSVIKSYPVGLAPKDVAVMYGGRYVIVTNIASKSVSIVDTVAGKVTTSDVGGAPLGISFIH